MAYRNKDDCIAEAERLGIDYEGMSWPELQKAVSDAVKVEEAHEMEESVRKSMKPKTRAQLMHERLVEGQEAIKPYVGYTVRMAHEIAPHIMSSKDMMYEEELGEDLIVEEQSFDIGNGNQLFGQRDLVTGTFKVKGSTGRKIKAQCYLPKEQAGKIMRPGIDYAPVVMFQGRAGYRWKNIKKLLKDTGKLKKYEHLFKEEPNMWYACGQLVCDPQLVHHVFEEIEEERKKEIEREKNE